MQHDINRLRLVTERYWELQGLRGALVGTGYVLGAGAAILLDVVAPPAASGEMAFHPEMMFIPAVALLIIAPGMLWLDRFYERTFGRLKPTAAARRFGLLIVPALLLPGLWMAPFLGARGYVAFFIGWAVVGFWVAVRDWPFRAHHLLGFAAGLLGAAVLWKVSAEQPGYWGMVWGFFVIGAACTVTGFFDHQLLATTLRGGRSADQPGEIKV